MDHVEVVMILVWFLYCNNYMEINLKKYNVFLLLKYQYLS